MRIRGSHLHIGKPGEPTILSIPLHDELALGTLRSLLRKARLSVDEFLRLLKDP
ncbi:type II toxin-antitoxin system HicA family toxin [Fervidibacter sp.]